MAFRVVRTIPEQERAKLYELTHCHHFSIPAQLFIQQQRNMQSYAEKMGRAAALPPVQATNHDRGEITVGQRLTEEQLDLIDAAFVRAVLKEAQILNGETAVSLPQASLTIPRQGPPPMRQDVAEVGAQPRILRGIIPGTSDVVVRIEVPPTSTHTVELLEDDEDAPAAAPAEPQEQSLGATIAGILYTPIGWIVGLFALLRKCLGL